jgi:tetratricopeptide (TPR) repeat protein
MLTAALILAPVFSLAVASNPAQGEAANESATLAKADAALQAGEADIALGLLSSLPASGLDAARGHNLICRVRFALGDWDSAVNECQKAVNLDNQNSGYHMWLARALGEKADKASFVSAFSLAKRSRAEFEEAVRLDPHNAPALADLGDFYRQAPGVVGGGIDKAQQIASRLDKFDTARAHLLRAQIAEQSKDYSTAEQQLRQAIAADAHPAVDYTTLASFYGRQKRFEDMESAIQKGSGLALHDNHAAVALYDDAGLLTEYNRDPALAQTLLEDYLAAPFKSEDAPAFKAHIRLARLKAKTGDAAAAERERDAALALASEYKPARDFNLKTVSQLVAPMNQQAQNHPPNR